MIKNNNIAILFCLALAACSGTKETLGLTKKAPDEFAVVKRAPLAMPPDYTLRPPQPGAPRPQEDSMDVEARAAVFGAAASSGAAKTKAEDILLQKTGGAQADPAIRRTVDREVTDAPAYKKPVAQRLLGWAKPGNAEPEASVVDAKAEAERLKKNAEEGKPVTAGETPSKQQ